MRTQIFLIAAVALALPITVGSSSWFGGENADSNTHEPAYYGWSTTELKQWLQEHGVTAPSHTPSESELRDLVAQNWHSASAWTYEQYTQAQRSFADVRDTTFEKWDESQLREFLLRQGIVAPKGPREQLVLLAKNRYNEYTDAAKSYADRAAQATKTLQGYASSASEAVTQVENDVVRAIDRSKDYVYSSWSDSKLRGYLEGKGLVKTKPQKKREELLAIMEEHYNKITNPIWEAWNDSYMHEWLVSHHIVKSDYEKNRDELRAMLQKYYYQPSDRVWSSWSDSDLRQWLVKHNVVKSEAQISRDKMEKMVEDNYYRAKDTFWSAWSDNQIREWLIDHGYLRSDAQVKRDELIKLADAKYNDYSAKTAAYLTWPDARLRAYLREHGYDDSKLPGSRPGLLQETRIRWVQTHSRAEAMYLKIREIVNEGVGKAEEILHRIVSIVGNGWTETKDKAYHGYEDAMGRSENAKNEL